IYSVILISKVQSNLVLKTTLASSKIYLQTGVKCNLWYPQLDKKSAKMSGRIIILPIDSSHHAEDAFDWFVKHIYRQGDKVHVVHCKDISVPSSFYLQTRADEHTISNLMKEAEKQSATLTQKYSTKMKSSNVVGAVETIFSQRPGEGIAKAAEEKGAAMVVMGSRGLGSIRRTILGSVSEYVIHHANCPVVIVPKR
ncbi:unnamed protein product, partial [Owenia fusiformis]